MKYFRTGEVSALFLLIIIVSFVIGSCDAQTELGLVRSAALVARVRQALREKGPDYVPHTEHLDDEGRPLCTNRVILE